MNTTPEVIKDVQPNEVVVFGSNRAGRHGAGLAVKALDWGAKYGEGEGLFGNTYAFPTKDKSLNPLPLDAMLEHVRNLEQVVVANPKLHFLVTKVGCGLAGYKPEQIAPMFKLLYVLKNVSLPKEFIDVILAPVNYKSSWLEHGLYHKLTHMEAELHGMAEIFLALVIENKLNGTSVRINDELQSLLKHITQVRSSVMTKVRELLLTMQDKDEKQEEVSPITNPGEDISPDLRPDTALTN